MPSLPQKHYLAALVWIALLGVLWLVMDRQTQPKVAIAEGSEIRVPRSRDGHFYVAGAINGQPVTFLVDTGASSVAVNPAAAARLGIGRGVAISVRTAGGTVQGEEVPGQEVRLGGLLVRDVRVLVIPGMGNEALLGQNVLRHLDVLQGRDDMVLRAR